MMCALLAPSLTGCSVFHWSEVDTGLADTGTLPNSGSDADSDAMAAEEDASDASVVFEDATGGQDVASEASVIDSPVDQGVDAPPASFSLADRCAEVALRPSSNDPVPVTGTSLLTNDISTLSDCGITRNVFGSDGFLAVQMNAGERWHFHVHGGAEQDLVLFLQSSCDPRTCVKAVDRCPKGQDEHLSVVAENTGTYYLGIDGLDGNANVTVLSVHPVCGDGQKGIHSKVCEDSNNTDGDGCDSKCRPEIKGTGSEVEPNGDTFGANVLRFSDAPVLVKGQIGGPCDTDMYSVQIPAGGSVRAVMRNEAGAPCTADLPGVTMKITDALGVERATGAPSVDSGTCPSITLGPVATAAEYFVSFATENSTMAFKYQLEVTLTKPVP